MSQLMVHLKLFAASSSYAIKLYDSLGASKSIAARAVSLSRLRATAAGLLALASSSGSPTCSRPILSHTQTSKAQRANHQKLAKYLPWSPSQLSCSNSLLAHAVCLI